MTAVIVLRRAVCSAVEEAISFARRTLSSYARCRARSASRCRRARSIESRIAVLSIVGAAWGVGSGAGMTSGFRRHAETVATEKSRSVRIGRAAERERDVIEAALLG